MSIAATLQKHLSRNHIAYDVLPHPPTEASVSTGQACRVPPDRLAKASSCAPLTDMCSRWCRRRAGSIGQSSRRNSARPSPWSANTRSSSCSKIALQEQFRRPANAKGSTSSSSQGSAISRTSISRAATTSLPHRREAPFTRASPLAGEGEGARERAWARASESGSVRRTGRPGFMRAPGPALV
jgi:hypothetical protein